MARERKLDMTGRWAAVPAVTFEKLMISMQSVTQSGWRTGQSESARGGRRESDRSTGDGSLVTAELETPNGAVSF